jgi:DivIVA domain-containing protein
VETIEKIRNATFTLTRRGYDRREVDSYLSKLADWLEGGGADQVHSETIKHELDRVGRKTSQILTAAQEAAESLRTDAQQDARQIVEDARIQVESTRSAADEYAKRTREEAHGVAGKAREDADDYAKRVRSEADAHASETLSSAEAKAIRMVEEGTKRRREIEKVIADLQTRREAVVKGLEKLSSQLAGAANQGMSVDSPPPSAPTESAPPPTNDRPSGKDAMSPATDATPPAPTRQ